MAETAEELSIVCPCCSATLGFDDCGEPFVLEAAPLPDNQTKGIGGLTVVEADERWLREKYSGGHHQGVNFRRNANGEELSEEQLRKLINPHTDAAPVEEDPNIITASQDDLKARGVVTN